ncbi:HNH endonuclease signature motif containing protein, partial [Mycobacterium sp. 1245805.9]|uniref:HNH endonuclease signature motif containing protein n=1 Tax=Mycobacterium sp. 1245805.9 TaxID=1856862 RepID=UPI0008002DA9
DVLTTPERLAALEQLERAARRLRAPQHELINQLDAQATPAELGGNLCCALADRLRITKAEAGRRIAEAEDLGERRALTGEALPPQLGATAAAQRDGLIGDGHVKVIRSFFTHLPTEVDLGTREAAEADLARKARGYRPDELAKYARRIMDWLHPDGEFSDQHRARRRGLTLGEQDFDGMSRLTGLITPELRAAVEALLAKLAAPGAANPDDDTPVIDDTPDEDAVRRDHRTCAQRNHDAFLAGLRALFSSGKLGSHNGLPVSIVAMTTLKELEAATGKALTGGGTLVPMSDIIRWAGHAHHYLAIFDDAKPLALYHTKRLASPAQRIMLYAKDRGCTKPGCDAPAYHSQVHHITGWTTTRRTDINDLTLACGPDNRLAEQGWTTRTNTRGETEWIPPPHLDHGQPRTNSYWHPERLFHKEEDDDDSPGAA